MKKSSDKKLLHGITNPSGSAYQEVLAEQRMGIKSSLLTFRRNQFQFPGEMRPYPKFIRTKKAKILARKLLFEFYWKRLFDAYHFHSLDTLTYSVPGREYEDIKELKRKNKILVFQFHGSDIRRLDLAKERYPTHYAHAMEVDPEIEKTKSAKVEKLKQYADLFLVSDYELLEWAPEGAKVAPRIVDEGAINEVLSLNLTAPKDKITVFHSPSNPLIKGTSHLNEAVTKLEKKYPTLVFEIVQNVPHLETLKKMSGSDIVIDQLLIGAYGKTAIEGMALGKPVVCYIRPDLKEKYYGNLPIVSANPDTLTEVLDDLISHRSTWNELGKAGQEYVREHHSTEAYIKFIEPEYRRIGVIA